MKAYFVRHGESVSNKNKTHQSPEESLSERGLQQAKAVAKRFESIPIELIISSDYKRALQTAEEISKVTQKEILINTLTRERSYPTSFRGKLVASRHILDAKNLMIKNRFNADWHHSDEENFYDVAKRVKEFFAFLEQRKEKSIAVVSHAAFIKALLTHMIFEKSSNPDLFDAIFRAFWTSNTGITVLEYRESEVIPKITNKKKWHLLTWNDYAHLG